jgi:hypothetical protein
MRDISALGVGSIHDITSDHVPSSKALLSLSISWLFVPMDCWFVAL